MVNTVLPPLPPIKSVGETFGPGCSVCGRGKLKMMVFWLCPRCDLMLEGF